MPKGPDSPLALSSVVNINTNTAIPPALNTCLTPTNVIPSSSQVPFANKTFQLSQNSAFNLALRSPSSFNAFQAAVAAGINGFTPPPSLYRFNEHLDDSLDYNTTNSSSATNSNITPNPSHNDRDTMDLINPYMRHHSFAAAAASQNASPGAVNLLNRSPPLHHHPNHLGNGFPDPSQMDYQNQLLDYHNAAAAAAYAANNNNHPLMLLKNNVSSDKLHLEPKSPRSADDSSTPPPLLSSSGNPADHHQHHSNNSQTSSRLQSESPDNCQNSLNQRSRYENNSSPGVDSSKSFSVSQRSSEEAGNNSESSPPPADYSPENLSNRKFTSSNTGHPLGIHNNNNIGLDHKLPLSFLGPPLAALHSMTEMKTAGNNIANNGSYGASQNAHIMAENRVTSSSAGVAGTTTTQTQGTANPHGIDTILSKPPPVTSAGLSALTGGKFAIFCEKLRSFLHVESR